MHLELFPKVKERVETVWDQDVLKRGDIKETDVTQRPFNSCLFIAIISMFAHAGE